MSRSRKNDLFYKCVEYYSIFYTLLNDIFQYNNPTPIQIVFKIELFIIFIFSRLIFLTYFCCDSEFDVMKTFRERIFLL
jgi:hypothetical protein